jgi:hypothetical protein
VSALSDYLENQMMQWALTPNAVTRPTQWFVALFTSPTDDGSGGTELSGGGYARVQATWNVTNNQGVNTAELAFPSSVDWPQITHVAVYDAATGGNRHWHGPLAAPRDPSNGDTIRFAAGQLVLQLD